MNSGFVKFKRNVAFLIFSCFFGISTQAHINSDSPKLKTDIQISTTDVTEESVINIQKKSKKTKLIKKTITEKTPYLSTAERVFLKTFVEIIWNGLEKKYSEKEPEKTLQNYKVEDINRYQLGKDLTNLIIDELIPNPNPDNIQRVIELLAPTGIALIAIDSSLKDKELAIRKFMLTIPGKLFWKFADKLVKVRFLQKKGTNAYTFFNLLATGGTFVKQNPAFKLKYLKNLKCFTSLEYFPFDQRLIDGTEKLILDQLKSVIQSMDFGETFNVKHRKKFIAKFFQTVSKVPLQHMLKPIIQLINHCYNGDGDK